MQHGIVVGGEVLPGTERVMRDEGAWWSPTGNGHCPRRGHIADQVVLHWTGSPMSSGPRAPIDAVRRMTDRKGKTGQPLKVGCHFLVFPDAIYQTCDLSDGIFHVGHRATARRSIGIEIDFPGTHAEALKLGIPHEAVMGVAKGQPVKCMKPAPELVANVVALVDLLCAIDHPAVRVPRKRGGLGKAGVLEHADMPKPSTKVDTASLFYRALGL